MRTVEQKVYEFKELSEEAKEKALEHFRDVNVDYFWEHWLLENWEERLEELGFINPKISYSGFWSQGDGASFTCDSIDFKKAMESGVFAYNFRHRAIEKLFLDNIEGYLQRSRYSHYVHENMVTVEWEIVNMTNAVDEYPHIYNELAKIGYRVVEQIEDRRLSLCYEIYRELEVDYNYLTSDEAVIETIEANGYEFLEDGSSF